MKIALFPGSFDPMTIAHLDIIKRAMPLFDKIVVGIGLNGTKNEFLTPDVKVAIAKSVTEDMPNVEVCTYSGLTIDYCEKINASFMIRGIRSVADFEYERSIAQINSAMKPNIDTVFILSRPEYSAISSTIVRDILRHKGDISLFVPTKALNFL